MRLYTGRAGPGSRKCQCSLFRAQAKAIRPRYNPDRDPDGTYLYLNSPLLAQVHMYMHSSWLGASVALLIPALPIGAVSPGDAHGQCSVAELHANEGGLCM